MNLKFKTFNSVETVVCLFVCLCERCNNTARKLKEKQRCRTQRMLVAPIVLLRISILSKVHISCLLHWNSVEKILLNFSCSFLFALYLCSWPVALSSVSSHFSLETILWRRNKIYYPDRMHVMYTSTCKKPLTMLRDKKIVANSAPIQSIPFFIYSVDEMIPLTRWSTTLIHTTNSLLHKLVLNSGSQ